MRARSIKIIDLSVHTVATIPLGTSVLDCSKAMRALHVGSLVVINDDRQPVGMITDRDICIEVVALEKDPKGLKVEDVMVARGRQNVRKALRESPAASADETVVDALARMREQGIRRLPVVDKDDKLCGIVTANNIVEEISEQLDSIVRAIKSSKTREQSVRP